MKIAQYLLPKLNPPNQHFWCIGTFSAHPKLSKHLLHCILAPFVQKTNLIECVKSKWMF